MDKKRNREKGKRYYYKNREKILKKQSIYQKDKGFMPTQISKKLNLTIDQLNHRWSRFGKIINVNSGRLI